MVSGISESAVEAASLAWFEEMGYAVLHGSDIAPGEPDAERQTYADVVLIGRLRSALSRINPGAPASALDEALRKVTRTETPRCPFRKSSPRLGHSGQSRGFMRFHQGRLGDRHSTTTPRTSSCLAPSRRVST